MVLASSNNVRVFSALETVIGEPVTDPNFFVRQRFLNVGIRAQRQQTSSEEIGIDRRSAGSFTTSDQLGGDIRFEPSFRGQEFVDLTNIPLNTAASPSTPWFSAGLQSNNAERLPPATQGTQITAFQACTIDTNTGAWTIGGTSTDPSNTGFYAWSPESFVDTAVPGYRIEVGGGNPFAIFTQGVWGRFVEAGNPRSCAFRVHHVISDTEAIIDSCRISPAEIARILASTGTSVDRMALIQDGSQNYGFTNINYFSDVDVLTRQTGIQVNTMSLGHQTSQISNGTFGLLGSAEETFSPLTGTNTPALLLGTTPTTTVRDNTAFNALSRATIAIGRRTGICAQDSSISTNNNMTQAQCIGGNSEIVTGTFEADGTVNAFLDDDPGFATVIEKERADNERDTHIAIVFQDGRDNTIVMEVPTARYTDGSLDVPGAGQQVPLNLSFSGRRHPGFNDVTSTSIAGLGPSLVRIWMAGN